MAAALALPLAVRAAADERTPSRAADAADHALAELIRRTEQAMSAFMRGDMTTYLGLIKHGDDFTLMQPFGGFPSEGFDPSPEHIARLAGYFKGGEAKLELVKSYASHDIIVLSMIERQHGEVGGLPDQDWSLRVTLVYRRSDADWHLVHRHADPLVHRISLAQAAALARG
ncbi:nuclear transport factor 2 family protein [Bradyrhizobium septentrionale]|uniref:Nuclear transport factor 2 family protein n=1 Tax=Bradyrhizobium septentrionale TaxID=1404411 RepID=A0A973W274_9BRAD|nr:nuclear transport factor 2 family protein [Bradyrhizobium septentrionale]UGY14671.1 nuclear transport factor 2 family protein [Bradyrhizobium septentrionale]UGY23245.1 nuclear transport factor 2 family protein [Bradyrhizobium septentrionale]